MQSLGAEEVGVQEVRYEQLESDGCKPYQMNSWKIENPKSSKTCKDERVRGQAGPARPQSSGDT